MRWLRPDYQNLTEISEIGSINSEHQTSLNTAVNAKNNDEIDVKKNSVASATVATQAWPATLPEQVHAVAQALASSPAPLTLEALAARFKGKGSWKKSLPTLLQALPALGRAQAVDSPAGPAWPPCPQQSPRPAVVSGRRYHAAHRLPIPVQPPQQD